MTKFSPEVVELIAVLETGQWDHVVVQGPNPTGFCTPDHPAPRQAAVLINEIVDRLRRVRDLLEPASASREAIILEIDEMLADLCPNSDKPIISE